MFRTLSLCFLLFGSLIVVSESSKILAIIPTASVSHFIFAKEFLNSLTEYGYEVTVVSPYENAKEQNYNFIVIPELRGIFKKYINSLINLTKKWWNLWEAIHDFYDLSINATETILENEKFKKLLHQKFDLVIIEQVNYEAIFGIGYHFGCPVIGLSSAGPSILTSEITGNSDSTAYIPNMMFEFSDHMTFTQRMINSLMNVFNEAARKVLYYHRQEELLHKYFPNAPDLYTVLHNVSLTFLNSHESLSYVRPLMPNTIQIGGVHIPKLKKLSQDLQNFMDSAKDGVILVSFGSNLDGEDLVNDMENTMVKIYKNLTQKIIWKWDKELHLDGLPNVKVGKWFPQIELLAHPNMKLFITHGGLGSVTEALWFGVPMLGIPIFADQFMNIHRITTLECGLKLHLTDLNEDELSKKIEELLENPKYAKNIKKRSALFRDQPMTPKETTRYWVEFVIKHGGAFHLRPAVFDLYWFQAYLLDTNATLLVIVLILLGIIYQIISLLVKLILLPFKRSGSQKITPLSKLNKKKN